MKVIADRPGLWSVVASPNNGVIVVVAAEMTALDPVEAGLFALAIQAAAAELGPVFARRAEDDRRRARPATAEPSPIGLPPLPPAGPSVRLGSEARPAAVEVEKNLESTPTKRRRKR